MAYPTQSPMSSKPYLNGYQGFQQSQTDNTGIEPDDENSVYKKLLTGMLNQPPAPAESGYDPAIGAFAASLNESANKLGTVGGRQAQSPEVGNFANALNQIHSQREEKKQSELTRRQNILLKLAELRDKQVQSQNSLNRSENLKNDGRSFQEKEHEKNRTFTREENEKKATAKEREDKLVGTKVADREFIKRRDDFLNGGAQEAAKNIKILEESSRDILDPAYANEPVSGPWIGLAGDKIRNITNERAMKIKRNLKGIAMRGARAVLGGGILTDNDIKNMVEQSFADQAQPEDNARTVRDLANQMKDGYQQMIDQIKWYDDKNTLHGYNVGSKLQSIDDIKESIPEAKAPDRVEPKKLEHRKNAKKFYSSNTNETMFLYPDGREEIFPGKL